ncbi:hypothetical protein BC830DRAFT_1174398 [Chytriomyces sp. MP71]|nr:hypothetical protein BC830DRAFT_1174398 [Chytriomyces sp. MP71]
MIGSDTFSESDETVPEFTQRRSTLRKSESARAKTELGSRFFKCFVSELLAGQADLASRVALLADPRHPLHRAESVGLVLQTAREVAVIFISTAPSDILDARSNPTPVLGLL